MCTQYGTPKKRRTPTGTRILENLPQNPKPKPLALNPKP